jgi:hypothetical protein
MFSVPLLMGSGLHEADQCLFLSRDCCRTLLTRLHGLRLPTSDNPQILRNLHEVHCISGFRRQRYDADLSMFLHSLDVEDA